MIRTVILLLTVVLLAGHPVSGQQPEVAGKNDSAPKAEKEKKKPEPYVLVGTVFTEGGFSLPGAQIRVRRAGEKKVRGEAQSDRRGEFGIRVPAGLEYEVTVEAKGYETQSRKFNAQLGTPGNFVFRLKPVSGGES